MSAVQPTPFYRSYELPWTGDPDSGRRFRQWLGVLLVVLAVFGIVIPMLPTPKASQSETSVPERLARVMMEKPKPPPTPPAPKAQDKAKPDHTKPVIKPPEPQKDMARQKAQKQLNKIKDDLANLRQTMDLSSMMQGNLSGAVMADAHAERSLITSKVGTGSGGIGSAPVSRNFGGGSGALGGHDTGAVTSTLPRSSLDGRGATRTGGASGKAARSREEIETVFDRNKGAIYAMYNRALRENPALQGKLVLEFTISPGGDVTMCRVVSSELNNKDLEEKIIARVRQFHFPVRADVEPMTTTKPIDFFPA